MEKLAILQTSRDEPEIARQFPPDGIKFQHLLQPVMPETELHVFDVVAEEYPANLDDYSAYLLTGSPASVTDSLPWIDKLLSVVSELHAQRTPMIGICFGHQVVAKALGGRVERSPNGWGLGIKPVRFESRPWMQPAMRELQLVHIHQDQVIDLPQGAVQLAGDEFCPHSSFTVGQHILTVQAHPEFDRKFLEAVLKVYADSFPADVASRAAASAQDDNHGTLFASWIANFLKQAGG